MEKLLPDYKMWRKRYAVHCVIFYFLMIAMELLIFLLLRQTNMILEELDNYFRLYFIRPLRVNTIIGIVSILSGHFIKNERIRNAVPVLAITCMFGNMAIVHNVFFIMMLLFSMPIFMTVVFGDKVLLYVTTGLSEFFVLHVVYHCYTKTSMSRSNSYFLPTVVIAMVALAVCCSMASTHIQLLNTQNQKLMNAVEEANEANESKSAFLSNMSHEIRTPMNAIVGIVEVMLHDDRSEEDKKLLNSIKRSGDALLAIINDILDFSKIESGKMELIEDGYVLPDMLEDLKLIFKNRIGDKPIEMKYDIDSSIPNNLWGDEIRLRQVIINLVNNAIKFTDSGYVKLTIKKQKEEGDSVYLYMAVSDSGQGIKKEDLPKLFSSFEQVNTKKNHKKEGTGLGLAISKQIVEMMGGEITVESEYGVGTTFGFTIVQKVDKNAKAQKSIALDNTAEKSFAGKRVLLVEDNAMNTQVALLLLKPHELEIDTAENGQVALEKVQATDYDLVFMDHMMPVMDGVEATQAIRALPEAKYQNLPIIALTANAIVEAKATLLEAGMNDVTTKPMDMKHIKSILGQYL